MQNLFTVNYSEWMPFCKWYNTSIPGLVLNAVLVTLICQTWHHFLIGVDNTQNTRTYKTFNEQLLISITGKLRFSKLFFNLEHVHLLFLEKDILSHQCLLFPCQYKLFLK